MKVADGYGRNFLLPRKLAMQATEANKSVIEQMKAAAARRSATEKAQAEDLLVKLEHVALSFTRKSWAKMQRYKSFGFAVSSDVASDLTAKGFDVDRRKIQLTEPLKNIGDYTISIKLHREVTAHIKVQVVGDAVAEEVAAGITVRHMASPLLAAHSNHAMPPPSSRVIVVGWANRGNEPRDASRRYPSPARRRRARSSLLDGLAHLPLKTVQARHPFWGSAGARKRARLARL